MRVRVPIQELTQGELCMHRFVDKKQTKQTMATDPISCLFELPLANISAHEGRLFGELIDWLIVDLRC